MQSGLLWTVLQIRTFKKNWNTKVLFVELLIALFGTSVLSALGFKARVDPSLACFLTCVQWDSSDSPLV